MNKTEKNPNGREIEIKLALPMLDTAALMMRLKGTSLLARRKPLTLQMHNVYYDTPAQFLRSKRMALRLRQVGTPTRQHWLQTLKTAPRNDSALSQRGEWEAPVSGNALSKAALLSTPWETIDPDGSVFSALVPCFTTQFERTLWVVRRPNGDVVEIALDTGHILAAGRSTPICELELELLSGEPEVLFQIAAQIAHRMPVLPLTKSKAQRGYELFDGSIDQPLQAQVPNFAVDLPVSEVVTRLMREMFCQFTTNLHALRTFDHPEFVHQARVGWRRFRSALRLFKFLPSTQKVPAWEPLNTLLTQLGQLRDLDVAYLVTLPPIQASFVAGDSRRQIQWQVTLDVLHGAADLQRQAVRQSLATPDVGVTLLETTQWLESLPTLISQTIGKEDLQPLRPWAKAMVRRQYDQFRKAGKHPQTAADQHKLRIRAKRLRYGVAALQRFLPKHLSKRWHEEAAAVQEMLGASRDLVQLIALVTAFPADEGVVEFLRGYAMGLSLPRP